jgi:small subunit ribosomal protein S8
MDSLSNMLVSIKNASIRFKDRVNVNYSKLNVTVLNVLKTEGFISNYRIIKDEKTNKQSVSIILKYTENKIPIFGGFKRVSKSSRRVYRGYDDFPRLKNSFGINIISTPKGVMSSIKAKKEKVGGEVLCQVW